MVESPKSRVILKLSGELFGENGNHIDFDKYDSVALQLIEIRRQSPEMQIAIVVGGGNIFRGRQADSQVDHTEADSMGMMATIINGLGLREAFLRNGQTDTRLMTSISMPEIAEPYIKHRGRHHLEQGRIVIIAGGLGRPNFSTDSAAAQCGAELQCDKLYKASTVDGIYDSDPRKNPQAKKLSRITFQQALDKRLGVMDLTAFAMCMRSNLPIFVFDIKDLNRLPEAINGNYSFGTIVQ